VRHKLNKKIICTIVLIFVLVSTIKPLAVFVHGQGQQPSVSLSPSSYSATEINGVFTITITISNVQGLWGWAADVSWNPQILSLTTLTEGDFLYSQAGGSGSTLFTDLGSTQRNRLGYDQINDAVSAGDENASGSGTLATMGFTVLERFSQTTIQANFTLLGPAPTLTNPNGSISTEPNPVITPVSNTAETTVTLQTTLPPEANAGSAQTVRTGTQVLLNGSLSISNGNNPTYTWTFLDVTKQTLTGKLATYTFKNPGTYLVTLTVADSLGSDNSTVTITVINAAITPPTITISGVSQGQTVSVWQTLTFTIDTSTLQNVTVKDFVWSWGDKTPDTTTNDTTATHAYTSTGNYIVNVTISYIDGINDFATTNVTVGSAVNSSPTPTIGSNPTVSPVNSSPSNNSGNDASVALPSTILGIIVAVTIFVLVGSVFWLRNNRNLASISNDVHRFQTQFQTI